MDRHATGSGDGLAAAIKAKKELVVGYDALHGRDPYRTDPCTRDPRAAKIIFTFQDSDMPTRAVDKRPSMSIYMSSPLQGCAHVGRVMYVRPPLPLQEILEGGCTLWHKDGSSLRLPVHQSRAPLFLADYAVKSAVIESPSGSALSVFYDYMPPMFENICGAATCMHAVDTNDLLVKRSKTSFGACQEMFTVHGNITIRKDRDGRTMVSFKGARDVRMVLKAVQEIAGMECTGSAGSKEAGCDVFNVHMAVVTALLGKKLSVYDECALERVIVNVARDGQRFGIEVEPRLRDENNMVKFKVVCWRSIYSALGICCDYESCSIENTVTVTGKGAVIIRLSWDRGVLWNKDVEREILSVCSALCALINECC